MDERALIEYVTQQRWYGAKSRTVSHSEVLDTVTIRQAEPQLALALVEMRYDTGAHDIYQLLLAGASRDRKVWPSFGRPTTSPRSAASSAPHGSCRPNSRTAPSSSTTR